MKVCIFSDIFARSGAGSQELRTLTGFGSLDDGWKEPQNGAGKSRGFGTMGGAGGGLGRAAGVGNSVGEYKDGGLGVGGAGGSGTDYGAGGW